MFSVNIDLYNIFLGKLAFFPTGRQRKVVSVNGSAAAAAACVSLRSPLTIAVVAATAAAVSVIVQHREEKQWL